MSTARDWYETTSIAQRRLTFLAPNGWLALCPLICEDLAQLEPVSELVRGTGPTLLLALLLDGPQLKERWSARYASGFADDPGTAVLTLTSLGMTTRSRRLEGGKPNEQPSRAVGLWKDAIRGWKTLELGKNEDAYLLTISADWTEEYTADGRTDHGFAAVFKYEGARAFSLSEIRKSGPKRFEARELENRQWLRGWEDIRELTAATYALDAAIQLEGDHLDTIIALLLGDTGLEFKERVPERIFELTELLKTAEVNPADVGVAAQPREGWPTKSLRVGADEIKKRLSGIESANGTTSYWERLTSEAIEQLKTDAHTTADAVIDDEKWVPRSISIAILAALHYRLDRLRRRPLRPHGGGGKKRVVGGSLTFREAADLLQTIEKALDDYA